MRVGDGPPAFRDMNILDYGHGRLVTTCLMTTAARLPGLMRRGSVIYM
jgi:hypothetical protein